MTDEKQAFKVHRIQTEDTNREGVLALLDRAFEAYTVNLSLGRWKGRNEPSLTIEVTGESYETVSKVAEDIRSMNSQEAVLISEYEPSKILFLFRGVVATFLGGFILLGLMTLETAAVHKVERQKYIEHMVFTETTPEPQPPIANYNGSQSKLSDIDTYALARELKKRLTAMDEHHRELIRRILGL